MSRSEFLAQRSTQKRNAILDAGRRRFAEDGFAGASMEAIAAAADVSTATLYKLFPSKVTLFTEIWRAELETFSALLDRASDPKPAARPAALALAYARLLDDRVRIGLLRAMLAGVSSTPEIGASFYEDVRSRVAIAFTDMALALRASGHIACASDDDARFAAGQLMGMVEHWMLWALLFADAKPKAPPEAIATAAAEAFWRAWGAKR